MPFETHTRRVPELSRKICPICDTYQRSRLYVFAGTKRS
jgi:hypothetical protein